MVVLHDAIEKSNGGPDKGVQQAEEREGRVAVDASERRADGTPNDHLHGNEDDNLHDGEPDIGNTLVLRKGHAPGDAVQGDRRFRTHS